MGTGKKIAPGAGVYYRGPVEDVRPFQLTISRRLLWWSVPSVILGTIGVLLPWPVVQGFALQALIWGGIDALLALLGLRRAQRRAGRYPDHAEDVAETLRLRRTLMVNGFLDIVYIAVGVGIVVTLFRQPFPLGNGIGVIVQGIFLLFFDFGHARRLPAEVPAWYSPSP
jgi:hypothetical protein